MTDHQVEAAEPADNRHRTVTLLYISDGTCSGCEQETVPLYSGGGLTRACAACVGAEFPPPPWEGDCAPEDADIVITHTRADGTLLEGSSKGDGIFDAIRSYGWWPFRSLGCLGITHSRDRAADRYKIDSAAEAIRKLGFTVCLVVNEDERRGFAAAEADREARAEDRAERFGDRAGRAAASSDASHRRSNQISERFYMGQPVIAGHHSEGRARRDQKRMHDAMRKSISEQERAAHWAQRAEASGAYAEYRTSPARTLRRIETKEAELRGVARWQRGESYQGYDRRLSPAVVVELARCHEELTEEIGYWQSIVTKAEAEGFKVWGKADFTPGDFALRDRTWYEVKRANPKSLTVPHILNSTLRGREQVCTLENGEHFGTGTIPYDEVRARIPGPAMREFLAQGKVPGTKAAKEACAAEAANPPAPEPAPQPKKRTSGPKMVIVTAAYGAKQARMVYANGRGVIREDIPPVLIDAAEGVTFREGPASAAVWEGVDEVLKSAGFVRLGGNGGRTGSPSKGIRAKITEQEATEPPATA